MYLVYKKLFPKEICHFPASIVLYTNKLEPKLIFLLYMYPPLHLTVKLIANTEAHLHDSVATFLLTCYSVHYYYCLHESTQFLMVLYHHNSCLK